MTSRHGITWVECTVAGGILSLALAVMLPGLLYYRAAARREQCLANLHGLGRAAQSHAQRHRSLPAGAPAGMPNWLAALLPELGEEELFQEAARPDGSPLRIPASLLCPVAPPAGEPAQLSLGPWREIAKGNYAGNFGADTLAPADPALRGVFDKQGVGVKRAEWAAAGGANTLLASELLAAPSPRDGRGAWLDGGMGGAAFTARLLPNSRGMGRGETNRDRIVLCDTELADTDSLHCIAHSAGNDAGTFAAVRSAHGGGVHALFLDGHTEFLPDGLDLHVWRNLATRQAD